MLGINRFFLLMTLVLALVSCEKRPEGVLSERKTIDVLSDLQLADAYIQMHGEYASIESRRALKLQVLKDNGVTEAEFDKTIDWYGHNMDSYSKLYEKVAKRLEKAQGATQTSTKDGDMESLWPYSQMAMLSNLGIGDGIRFSLSPTIKRGDQIEWSMRTSDNVTMNAVLGVEYADGGMSLRNRTFGGTRKLSITLQTDSTRDVKRLFGTAQVTSRSVLPLWLDSILIVDRPFNRDTYGGYSSQQNLLAPGKNKRINTVNSTQNDSLSNRSKTGSDGAISEKAIDAPISGISPSAGGYRPGRGSTKKSINPAEH
ncbi:MAG: DUF4296 domain-containing protein [Prevotella sp.]|nr:DUF4296 domain-containing protein [Bacteroides sp.]MCM1365782.1 DUF4296 domain-containing protein [Prevotella sp.]MCM1436526.1 DUF4296 domain-containing protein [Prevotella sp.]